MKNARSPKWTWLAVFALISSTPAFADTSPGGSILQLRAVIPTNPERETQPGAEKMKMEVTDTSGQSHPQVLWVDKTVVIDQSDVQSASVTSDTPGTPLIEVALTPKGSKRFAEFTRQNLHKRLAIIVDGQLVSAPIIQSEISGGKFMISGNFTPRQAANLRNKINQALQK